MKQIKTITIDQLTPGMFIVGMDQPWYRTPFLLHKHLIRHTEDIKLLRQHGIREVKIDPGRGLDVEPNPSGNAPPTSSAQETAASPQPSLAEKPASLEKPPQPAADTETIAAQPQPPVRQEDTPRSSKAREQAAAAQETYREAACSMERMFEELEAGIVPRPDTLRTVVGNVLSRVLDDGASMLSLLSLQKMKRF
ncbi:MAG: DUF3391 domain-containing protein, partial [Nitrospirota bacterium]